MLNAMLPDFSLLARELERPTVARPVGWVTRVIGSTVEASGPEVPVGALVSILQMHYDHIVQHHLKHSLHIVICFLHYKQETDKHLLHFETPFLYFSYYK